MSDLVAVALILAFVIWLVYGLVAVLGDAGNPEIPWPAPGYTEIVPPTEPEMVAASVFMIESRHTEIVERTGLGEFRISRLKWIYVLITATPAVWFVLEALSERSPWIIGLHMLCATLFLLPLISVARTTSRRRRLSRAPIIRGVGQCVKETFDGDSGPDSYDLTMVYVLIAPVRGSTTKYVVDRSRWPAVGARVPVAIAYVSPSLYHVL